MKPKSTPIPFQIKYKAIIARLKHPWQIQDFLNKIPINREKDGDTCVGASEVLRRNKAHCIEGAMLAAAILRQHGHPPIIMDLKTTRKDFDHVVALFKIRGYWGAISKTNHAVLRYRDPIYKTIRELALSYFHEYFLDSGEKTLRSYSKPFNLSRFDYLDWENTKEPLFAVAQALDDSPHVKIVDEYQKKHLRYADKIERQAGKLEEYK